MRSVLTACFLCAIITSDVLAAMLWCGANPLDPLSCPTQNPDNGHWYGTAIPSPSEREISWFDARDGAAAMTFRGVPGHLATITSAAENDFLNERFFAKSRPKWIGGSDAEVEGEWRWVVGPEAGQLFWKGGPDGEAIMFADWSAGTEPNDDSGLEDYATTYWQGNSWNDLRAEDVHWHDGYIVEFSVPEPSTYAILAIGGTALAMFARRRRRRN